MSLKLLTVLTVVALACQRTQRAPVANDSTTAPPAVVTPAPRPEVKGAGCGDRVIRERSVGVISIGDPVDSLRKCNVVRDTVVPADEGMTARKVFVAFAADTVRAEIVNDRVWRIEVVSPGLPTTDSIRVGTPLRRLLALGNPRGITGEGRLFLVTSDHCGLSFQLSPAGSLAHRGAWDRAALSKLPESTAVSRILIIGCGIGGSPPAND